MKSLIQLLEEVINEDTRQIVQAELRRMEGFLRDITFFSGYQQKEPLEILKIWLQLLQSSITEAKGLLARSGGCFDSVMCNPRRLSKEIRVWKAFFSHLYQGFQTDFFRHIVLSGNVINKRVVCPVTELLNDVMEKEADNREILQTDLKRMESLLQDITTLFRDEPDIATLFQCQKNELLQLMRTCFQMLQSSLTQAKGRFDLDPRRLSKEIREYWSVSFEKMYHGFQFDLLILMTSLQFVSSKPLYKEDTLLQGVAAASTSVGSGTIDEAQPLSQDEGWMLFRRVAFKDAQVSMEIEERARIIADECRGLRLAINVVAAAMIGRTSALEWDNCSSSIKSVDPSFPTTHPSYYLDAELYARLRYGYDSLPNSEAKRCFLYCAMHKKDEEIDTDTILQMWIGEGLVKSKQGTYVMDMAIGRKYLKLLVDRFLFQRVSKSRNIFRRRRTIRVPICIHEMAVYIGQREKNCLFMANQNQQEFPEVHDEKCSRISVANNSMQYLPTHLRFPNLASLTLQRNGDLKELPSEFYLKNKNFNNTGFLRSIGTTKHFGHEYDRRQREVPWPTCKPWTPFALGYEYMSLKRIALLPALNEFLGLSFTVKG